VRSSHNGPVDVTPSAARLTSSLRDIGYDFTSAVADIVDNSVTAGATEVNIEIVFDGTDSYVVIADDGDGMSESQLFEALRFGTRRDYDLSDLGRYGLGLKTASLSQSRRVSVVTRRAVSRRWLAAKTLDLDHISSTDRWEVIDPPAGSRCGVGAAHLAHEPGTVVLWENLDRVLPEHNPQGGWARRRIEHLALRTSDYLGMVFHRYLEGTSARSGRLIISVNGEKVMPWNPFAPLEESRLELAPHSFEVAVGDLYGRVTLQRCVLPPRSQFSSMDEFERMSGPLKWNRQQGLYIYRADRLVQHGGWAGIRSVDEHTKFARASVDFETDLDALFQINVAKMRVVLPIEVKTLLERPIHELCHRADAVYRRDTRHGGRRKDVADQQVETTRTKTNASGIATALISAALNAGEHEAFARVMDQLRLDAPEVADSLGW
jgi:hypothetical protein